MPGVLPCDGGEGALIRGRKGCLQVIYCLSGELSMAMIHAGHSLRECVPYCWLI